MNYELDEEDFGTLCICAIRYCQGRETYMPDLVQSIVKPFLPVLSDKDIGVMVEDCERQRKFCLYGNIDVDKPGWIKWENAVRGEQRKRYKAAKSHNLTFRQSMQNCIDKGSSANEPDNR